MLPDFICDLGQGCSGHDLLRYVKHVIINEFEDEQFVSESAAI